MDKAASRLTRRACMRGLILAGGLTCLAPGSMAFGAGRRADLPRRVLSAGGRMPHGVYPGGRSGEEDDITAADVDSFEAATGAKADWIVFSHNWYHGRAFPRATAGWIRARGAIPHIRLMLRSSAEENRREPLYDLRAIARGRFDADLTAWGKAAAGFATPIICEFGTEMNGQWFPWNGVWNGGRRGPGRFRAAYRHIIAIMRQAGAENILWVFHVNDRDDPARWWNRFEAYYPGDSHIDLLGVSIYSALGPRDEGHQDFASALSRVMARFAKMAPDKLVIVAEMGTDVHNRRENAARWARRAMEAIHSGKWPNLAGWAWWNERWQNDDVHSHDSDLRVQSDPALARVLREFLQGRENRP